MQQSAGAGMAGMLDFLESSGVLIGSSDGGFWLLGSKKEPLRERERERPCHFRARLGMINVTSTMFCSK